MLKITRSEFRDILRESLEYPLGSGNYDRFEIISDEVCSHTDKLREYEFKDTLTGNHYEGEYINASKYDFEVPLDMYEAPEGIEFVSHKESDLYIKPPTFKMSIQDLEDIRCGELKINGEYSNRFVVEFDNIPDDGNPQSYIEDDGRQYRICEFKDTETGQYYYFNYTWNPDWDNDFSGACEDIQIVPKKESDFYTAPVVTPEPVPVLSLEQLADEALMSEYNCLKVEEFDKKKHKVPKKVMKDLVEFVNTGEYNMLGLRAKIIPVCIEYQIEQKSFWTHIQKKRGAWK